jgi:hypothetical protein
MTAWLWVSAMIAAGAVLSGVVVMRSEGAAHLGHAFSLLTEIGQTYNQAIVLDGLGDAYRSAGDKEAAHRAWVQAAAILDDLRHPCAAQVQAKLRALSSPPAVLICSAMRNPAATGAERIRVSR